jgi:hypothetical protein
VNRADIRAAAEKLRRKVVDDPAGLDATIEDPIPVETPTGELDSWFVALTADEQLLGFFQLEPDLVLHRYSTFDRPPLAADWLDRGAIRGRARTAADDGDRLGEPTLTYLSSRDRLAWRVPIANRPAAIYVSGEHIEVVVAGGA